MNVFKILQKIKSRITNQKDENKDLPKYLPLPGFKKISSCSFEILSLCFHFHQNSLEHFSQGRFKSIKLLSLNYLRMSEFTFFKDIAAIYRILSRQFLFQHFVLSPCLLTSLVVVVVFWVQGAFIFNENHLLLLLRTSCFCFANFKILFLFSFWKFNYSVSI